MKRIVLIAGFESFNANLYRKAAELARQRCPQLEICTFSDRDLTTQPDIVEQALQGADVFFASLLFDYDQVEWLRQRVQHIPIRLVFESALELMSLTQIGEFKIGDKPKGMPKPVKFILDKFGNGREEDKLAGYISFLKVGPKLLKYIPAKKVQDLRNWLIIYGYWNAGGTENVAAMMGAIALKYLNLKYGELPPPIETPNMGLLHPDASDYFTSPKSYLDWYSQTQPASKHLPKVGILLYRKHVITQQPYIPQLIRHFEKAGLIPVPIFINGVEGHVAVRDWLTTPHEQTQRQQGHLETPSLSPDAVQVDSIVSTIGFPLVGGPAGSMEAGRQVEVAKRILSAKNVPYFVSAPLLIQDIHSWTRKGIGGLQSVVLYALPELDGAIDPVPLGGLVGEDIYLIPERINRLTERIKNWIKLRKKPPVDRKIAIILYGFPPGYGATGTAALLNVPKSLLKLLQALKEKGYAIGNLPQNGEELIQWVKAADESIGDLPKGLLVSPTSVNVKSLEKWLGYLLTTRIEKQWKSLTQTGIKTLGENLQVGGIQLGNIWIGVQPPLGISGDPMRLMFERDLTPHPQYAAFYKWLQNDFKADAVVHFGMHGTVEWLPGSPLGNTGYSWSDILLGNLPNLYIYAANNPSESILAKRRGYGVLISHNVPPYGRAGLYKELVSLRELVAEYREDPEKNYILKEAICQKIVDTGLDADCPLPEAQKLGIEFSPENARLFSAEVFDRYLVKLYEYLQILENRLFSSGLHVLGEAPDEDAMQSYLDAYFGPENLDNPAVPTIRDLLNQTPDELTNLLRGLNGEYIPPAPGGDLLRDGPGVLPTGRNIHALDPYRMPSPAAYERGREIAKKIIAQQQQETGEYPETVAVMLWGLDAIKTKGESLGILLELVGAEPVKEGTGRIVRYELKPLSQVGHPRIDVLANLSGIFRDSFVNIIELLDDLFQRAAQVDEPEDQNFIRKHALALQAQGVQNTTARLFSNPAGDFGSLVNDQVVASNWETGDELAQTWEGRNAFSYGRQDKGQARPEVLQQLLKTTGRVVQEIDSVEYGLTDIQEYYANTGGLKRAAEKQQGKKVKASFIESFSKDTTPRNLESLLRMEYRTKLLNPKWAEAMANQGSGGAYEISQRMTALLGWGGTVDFTEDWVYDQAASTYALDPAMAEKLRKANPEAFRNIVGRMLEANGRGFWQADNEKLQQLRNLYEQAEADIEGVGGKSAE
ncbi:magnesium chelatase subunit H [Desertifilum sp. FACHB-1129]|uniref:magnesium chelatase n=1 Tax=Desertifilum tharense IPPAS B-1220 TaxID=1781255 RepID=A0A1E5QKC1_9CYAN|nr:MULTISPECIES: magnesium chelatase subunit H [Desertifilum]MDA0211131.1 magnesium chelatase subunit H [Cyanobacteria bacterium FC1]MBD2314133.1 magnesium chelatase subunit H [Desertifilum sp. FACHB-1129]MBD2320098.1 magnesium chelatase subunit H [Desertifilum sp. FACHB-866]MBD2330226.1 magnesium chelatase subunit H [Desertifilum sp. FACHB-868]OEJ75139.1 magnesium chelatase subunit H [Desertifilum tharense IPPAS B-1220]